MLYAQLLAFPVLSIGGIFLGVRVARVRWWWMPVVLAFLVIGVVILGERTERWRFVPPMAWLVRLEWNPLVMTAAIAVLLTILLVRLPRKSTKCVLGVAMGAMLLVYGLFPAVMALAARGTLLSTATRMDYSGVCRQSHGFSCGPASAVTCLGRFGYHADEGALAVAARCGPGVGTDGWALAAAMERAAPGLRCTYCYVGSLDALSTPCVADMNIRGIGGHYVAVLAVEKESVLVGDPMGGPENLSREVFESEWKHGAIEVEGKGR